MALIVSATEVKDRVANIKGLTLPAGATDARIEAIITIEQDSVLAAFGVTSETQLSAPKLNAAKGAILNRAHASLILAFFPINETIQRVVDGLRRQAREDIDRAITGAAGATPGHTRPFISLR